MKFIQEISKNEPREINPENGVSAKGIVANATRHFKKIILLAGVAGAGLFFNSCTTSGYVATEPVYVESVRTPQPSTLHIWVDGDWVYSRQSHSYVQRNGYWSRPYQGRTYKSGYWETTPRGHRWESGHWQRRNR